VHALFLFCTSRAHTQVGSRLVAFQAHPFALRCPTPPHTPPGHAAVPGAAFARADAGGGVWVCLPQGLPILLPAPALPQLQHGAHASTAHGRQLQHGVLTTSKQAARISTTGWSGKTVAVRALCSRRITRLCCHTPKPVQPVIAPAKASMHDGRPELILRTWLVERSACVWCAHHTLAHNGAYTPHVGAQWGVHTSCWCTTGHAHHTLVRAHHKFVHNGACTPHIGACRCWTRKAQASCCAIAWASRARLGLGVKGGVFDGTLV